MRQGSHSRLLTASQVCSEKRRKKVVSTATIKKVVEFDSKFGKTRVHIMEDSSGNIYTWVTNTKSLIENQKYKITATIKAHEIYHGERQNVLTRCVAQLV